MVDPIVHFEIPADDVKRAKAFYEALFGWKITYMKEFEYYSIKAKDKKGNGIDGGMMKRKAPGQPPMNYVHVSSIDATLKKAVKAGAKMCLPKTPIGDMGAIAAFQDPEGNMIGLHEISAKGMKEMVKRQKAEAKKKR